MYILIILYIKGYEDMTDYFSKIKQQDIKMTNDITIDCSTATLNFRPHYYYMGALKILIDIHYFIFVC